MKLGAVWVHYRTPELVADAVRSVAAEAQALGVELCQVVVDHSSEPGNRERWSELEIEHLVTGRNLGYAGGVQFGVRHLPNVDVLLLANPDCRLLPGSLDPLLRALQNGTAAAGPRFCWDSSRRWLLPPTEERTPLSELLSALALRSSQAATWARRRWRSWAWRHWDATNPLPSLGLSGALILIHREAWEKVGPFDAEYPLYFEETDWLLRLCRAGGRSVFVPRSLAWHLYAQSSLSEPRVTEWFETSARRFRLRAYGRPFTALLAQLERWALRKPVSLQPWPSAPTLLPFEKLTRSSANAVYLEIAQRPQGFPAARVQLKDLETSPNLVPMWPKLGALFATLLSAEGVELERYRWKGALRDAHRDNETGNPSI